MTLPCADRSLSSTITRLNSVLLTANLGDGSWFVQGSTSCGFVHLLHVLAILSGCFADRAAFSVGEGRFCRVVHFDVPSDSCQFNLWVDEADNNSVSRSLYVSVLTIQLSQSQSFCFCVDNLSPLFSCAFFPFYGVYLCMHPTVF